MGALLLALGLLLPLQDGGRVDEWIRDLGSENYETRQKADEELRKIGEPAVEALKKAAEDPDAERAMRARSILKEIEGRPKVKKREGRPPIGMTVIYKDLTGGITFKMETDGRVELTVPEENPDTGKREFKTYRAESLDEFKQQYPEVSEKYNVERYLPKRMDSGEFEDWWGGQRKRFDFPFGPEWRDPEELLKELQRPLREWEEKQKELEKELDRPKSLLRDWEDQLERLKREFEELRKSERIPSSPEERLPVPSEPGGKTFGVRIAPVNDALRAQLELAENEGIQVEGVSPGSLAERSGVQQHDILTKLNGRTIEDRWKFREEIRQALSTKEFTVEVLRGGKRQTLTIRPEGE